MRAVFLTVALSIAALIGVAAQFASPPASVVTCADIIGNRQSGQRNEYRVVLGVISAPPAHLAQIIPTHTRPWPYWRKAGLAIHAGRVPVSVTVPRAWRSREAITWGDSGVVSSLRIGACPRPPDVWNGYAGGFYLRSPSACVPLIFHVGSRSTTVLFGLGRTCT